MATDSDTLVPPAITNRQTTGADKNGDPRISTSSNVGQSITIRGLNTAEYQALEGMLHGHNWVTVSDLGRLRVIPTYKELPPPVDDTMMLPFWGPAPEGSEEQYTLFRMEPVSSYSSPSITIQHLCGYGFTQERYAAQAKNLMRWGFECLRSRRGASGQYHELWYLMGLWAAQGELRAAIEKASKKDETGLHGQHHLDAAISFLLRNASFGTLDASNQRAAMSVD